MTTTLVSPVTVVAPSYMSAFDDDWNYYVLDTGDLADSFRPIGEPDEFTYERLWMQPVRASATDPEERPEGCEALTRDARGRFAPVWLWWECREGALGAVAYYGARYKQ